MRSPQNVVGVQCAEVVFGRLLKVYSPYGVWWPRLDSKKDRIGVSGGAGRAIKAQ